MLDHASPPFLRFDRVTRRYADQPAPALADVSFSMQEGSTALITGESGSGKTTLLNLAAGLDRPDEGTVWIEAVRLSHLGEAERAGWRGRTVSLIFQQHFLASGLRVIDAVASPLLWARRAGVRAARREALAVLRDLGLEDTASQRVERLSGGQRQRTAIARALITRPRLLLADEPISQLDRATGSRVVEYLRRWAGECGATMLVVSHEHSSEEWGAGSRYVLRDGRLKPD